MTPAIFKCTKLDDSYAYIFRTDVWLRQLHIFLSQPLQMKLNGLRHIAQSVIHSLTRGNYTWYVRRISREIVLALFKYYKELSHYLLSSSCACSQILFSVLG